MKKAANRTLSAPLRVFWDIAAVPDEASRGPAERVARELASLKVFFVTLRLVDGRRDDLGDILGLLKAGGTRVTVSISGTDSLPGPDALKAADAVDLSPADAAGLGALLERINKEAPAGKPMSVSVVPSKANTGALLEMISDALGAGIRTFNLINPGLVYDCRRAPEFVLGERERKKLARGLESLLMPFGDAVKLFVHDLFLHRELELPGLPARIEYAGCQAGEAIMYIDRNFTVYPCSTMPVALGSLLGGTVKDIWSSEGRRLLRERVEKLPEQCAGCPEAEDCKGGCRGLAWEVGGAGCMDPGCGKYTGLV